MQTGELHNGEKSYEAPGWMKLYTDTPLTVWKLLDFVWFAMKYLHQYRHYKRLSVKVS